MAPAIPPAINLSKPVTLDESDDIKDLIYSNITNFIEVSGAILIQFTPLPLKNPLKPSYFAIY